MTSGSRSRYKSEKSMLRFENIEKRYGGMAVFPPLTQHFGAGCVALMSDNGTGKSTLITILSGTQAADAGEIWIDGYPHRGGAAHEQARALAAVAYVPDDCLTHPQMTGRALLEQVTRSRSASDHTPAPAAAIDETALALAERLGAAGHLDHRFEQMSLGTRKKMYLSAMLIGSPAVIVADEPSNGLDAPAVRVLADCFKALAQTHVVFFSTHDPRFAAACEARVIGFDDLLARP